MMSFLTLFLVFLGSSFLLSCELRDEGVKQGNLEELVMIYKKLNVLFIKYCYCSSHNFQSIQPGKFERIFWALAFPSNLVLKLLKHLGINK